MARRVRVYRVPSSSPGRRISNLAALQFSANVSRSLKLLLLVVLSGELHKARRLAYVVGLKRPAMVVFLPH